MVFLKQRWHEQATNGKGGWEVLDLVSVAPISTSSYMGNKWRQSVLSHFGTLFTRLKWTFIEDNHTSTTHKKDFQLSITREAIISSISFQLLYLTTCHHVLHSQPVLLLIQIVQKWLVLAWWNSTDQFCGNMAARGPLNTARWHNTIGRHTTNASHRKWKDRQ